jgi:hypothetical protein
MTEAFQPKFADLVRNYTTTTGMDDFVLGSAVNGFTSIADACEIGDNFYYSAVGIDNPGETEVGRGTLLAGGVISRDPFSGHKTNFKSGTKSIALVAAAEWFAEVDAVRANGSGMLNVLAFGAKGDSDASGSSGTDDTAAIQAAIDFVGAQGGGTLYIPDGFYKISSYLTLAKDLKILMSAGATIVATHAGGGGADASEDLRNGSALYSNWPSNASNPVHITIDGGAIICANGSNQGAAFYDNCGTQIRIRHVKAYRFKYGLVCDQTELIDVSECDLSPADMGGACVWLVNGTALRAGNLGGFTNRISVRRCQINAGASVYGILDDGGTAHAFADNNYNGCLQHIRAAGVLGLSVTGGEFESAVGPNVWLGFTALAGYGVGSCGAVHFNAPVVVPTPGNPCVDIFGAGTITFTTPFFGNSTSAKVVGAANAFAICSVGAVSGGGGPIFDGEATHHYAVGQTSSGAVAIDTNVPASAWAVTGDADIAGDATIGGDASVAGAMTVMGPISASNLGTAASHDIDEFIAAPATLAEKIAWAKQTGQGVVLAQSGVQVLHTGDTALFDLASITLPGGSLGANGQLVLEAQFGCTNSANNKTFQVKLGPVTIPGTTVTTTTGAHLRYVVANRNSTSSKVVTQSGFANGSPDTTSVNTAVDQPIKLQGQLADGGETVRLESYQITLYPQD